MHHQSVARDILAHALQAAHGSPIRGLHVAFDPEGHVTERELTLAIELLAKGTAAEGARITVSERRGDGVLLESIDIAEVK